LDYLLLKSKLENNIGSQLITHRQKAGKPGSQEAGKL
jgi:hypothetical protein